MFEVKEVQAKSIMTETHLKDADFDYSVNPYIGCRFGCIYCYASFMGRFVGKKVKDWGEYVYAKVNAPELLEKEIKKLKDKGSGKTIWFSSVTDPYQGLEMKYQLTRKCLEVLVDYNFAGTVSILTKSDLVLRDIDIFKKLENFDVGLTITATDDKISRFIEKFAPAASARLKALKKLHDEGFSTYAFVGPLLPHILADEKELEKLFMALSATGNREIYVEYLNLSNYLIGRLKAELKDIDKKTWELFLNFKKKDFRRQWDKRILKLVKKYNFKLRFGGTLYHPEME
ncbi:radical SAM protein [Candidatus Microgenomates bacterium]|nr:radical SAM protein [Candidatus Microgenomates bacterium]